jgi:hypothetical protein
VGHVARITEYLVLNTEAVSQEQLQALPDKIQTLMERIRPHAVSIVDAWMIPDYLLDRYVITLIYENKHFSILLSLALY